MYQIKKRGKNKKEFLNLSSPRAGFTLIEILVVAGITGFIASAIIINFSRTRLDLNETASIFVSDTRIAQSQAASSTKYGGAIRCGYGIRYIDSTSYAVYAGPDTASADCAAQNKNFGAEDTAISVKSFLDTRVEFKNSFYDIFFEPPDPKTYINNNATLGISQTITLGKKNAVCPSDCKTITIFTSGKIDIQ